MREILKPLVEILAGFPSVVMGFIGILILSPFCVEFFNLPTGLSALAGAILLGWAAIPTIVSISEDAINSVPRSYREASLALGATEWETIWGVTLPAARSGVMTAVMLGHWSGDWRDDDGYDGDRQCADYAERIGRHPDAS